MGIGASTSPQAHPYPDTDSELPDFIYDPITHNVFADPVVLGETGRTYERATLRKWLLQQDPLAWRDPLTNAPLLVAHLVPNWSMRDAVAHYTGSDLPPPESPQPQSLRLAHLSEQAERLGSSVQFRMRPHPAQRKSLLTMAGCLIGFSAFSDATVSRVCFGAATLVGCLVFGMLSVASTFGRMRDVQVQWRPPVQPGDT
jgi:hypothetical protein